MSAAKRKTIWLLFVLLAFFASSAIASIPKPDSQLQPVSIADRAELFEHAAEEAPHQPLIDRASFAWLDEVSHVSIDPQEDVRISEVAPFDDVAPRSLFAVNQNIASGLSSCADQTNVSCSSELGAKTWWGVGFHAYPFVEPANGLVYARARWYDPSTGTFVTPDPMGYVDSSNMYAFCGGDPVNCTDPTGMEGWDPASWGHWIDEKKEALKRKVGAASIALAANTGSRVLDTVINTAVGSVETGVSNALDLVGGVPVGLLTIGEASGTALVEQGCKDVYTCGMTASAIIGDASSTVLYATGIAGAVESRLAGLKPTSVTRPATSPTPAAATEADAARLARVDRIRTIREALTDANGKPLGTLERNAVRDAIRRIEGESYQLQGSIKYRGNQGIDLYFRGVGDNAGRVAFAEAKASGSLGSLATDALGIRQGSYEFFRTRLARGIVEADPALRAGYRELYGLLRNGQADMFGYFGNTNRLVQFMFNRSANFRTTPGAAVPR